MSDDFDKYLAIANHDIQMANDYGELKSYVASILYDNDKKVELLQQKENIIKEVRNWVKSTIDIIKQQPTGNDEWILERLNSFLKILDKGE